MQIAQTFVATALFTLVMAVPLGARAETQSEKELDAATFSASESQIQVKEEEAVEKKSGMDMTEEEAAKAAKTEGAAATEAPK
jgi:hypothetical protein